MSFFGKEYFNLSNGIFQTFVDTATSGNGVVYQDGTYGYIDTYANADGGIIVSAESLTPGEFNNHAIKIAVSYKLTSLTASDLIHVFSLNQSATQPTPGSVGNARIACFLYNDGGTYKEFWYYIIGGVDYYWKQSTSAWASYASSSYVRTISLNTLYTITITIYPDSKLAYFTNGTQSATTGIFTRGTDPWWWLSGDISTSDYYGQLVLDYLYVEDITARNRFSILNSFTKPYKKSPFFTALNNLTTRHRDSFTVKNSILDHEPYRARFTALNNIGVEGQLIYLDGSWQTVNVKGKQLSNRATVEIDGVDVSNKVTEWSIDYDDTTICKTISVTVKDRAFAQSIVTRRKSDSDFDDPRIEIIDHQGYSLGQFVIENKTENAAHKSYSCTLTGRSMTALLDRPYSENLQTLYDEATSKSVVVGDLADAKGLTVLRGIPDAPLPAGALACDDEPPISVIKKVVEAGGGLVYTDRSDNLICAYKDYETTGKTPVMSLSSGDIVSISQSRTVPTGENQITVEGYTDTSITEGWAQISIEASKYKLKSNGYDSCTITATCRNEDLSIPDVELIEDEEQTPATNDHYEISVSKMIDTEGGGVVSIIKQSDSSVVAGPYEILDDGRTIRVGTAMADTTYLVTYYGGETVAFSVDNNADISPTEVLVRKGRAQATLRASSGGGGYAVVSADYLDAQTAQLTVTIADPRVGQVDVSCDPSSVSIGETSTVTVQVLDSDGFPAQNGLYVDFSVIGYGQMIEYAGVVNPTTATTTTEQITDGGIENGQYNPIYPVSEVEVSTQYAITTLISIYRYEKGQPYTDVNYATGATVDGSTITLSTPLPSSVTPIQVTYERTGMATTTFTYPSYRSVPKTSITNAIVAKCGGEAGLGTITVESPYGSGTGGGGTTNTSDRIVRWLKIEGTASPDVNSNGQCKFTGIIYWPNMYTRANVNTSNVKKAVWAGVNGEPSWNIFHSTGDHYTIVSMIVQATQELPKTEADKKTTDSTGKTYVSGTRIVKDSTTDAPIPNAAFSIAWGDDTETGYTDTNGILSFSKGQPGLTGTVTLTKAGYETTTASISIPGDKGNSNVDTGDDSDTSVTNWGTVQVRVYVSYQWESI